MASALVVSHLKKDYGSVHAVKDLSFDVLEGEIFGLIGPNGAGKTTTLECVLGLNTLDSGSIYVCGFDLLQKPDAGKELIGAQLQNSQLPDTMTPRQALKLCGAFYKTRGDVNQLIERFQLNEKADTNFASLSGGQKQRLSLALAFVNNPKLVILDEPTVGLDPKARKELHELIAEQRKRGVTIIFTTHYLEEARSLCDRIALIARGSIIAIDTPEALIAKSKVMVKIKLRTSAPVLGERLSELNHVLSIVRKDDLNCIIETSSVNKTITALTSYLDTQGIELVDLQIIRPTLDDVFKTLVNAEGSED
ncbi:MAG: ABC transporter ATP-binding protein [Verrucomicrobiota bacterium]|jgi:ABC-2 type transport system ATP-binding protein|nr:MAG: ABC transporter ATP-binding protein [Verrucomicrobiota bacterium]